MAASSPTSRHGMKTLLSFLATVSYLDIILKSISIINASRQDRTIKSKRNDDIKKSPSCIASNLTTSISAVLIATHTAHAFFVNLIFA